jgi:cyclopropane fatty-acyl-phospholipid synthase-like methyltransferase
MNIDYSAIFSQCVYDVDNRYVDLTLRPDATYSRAFTLTMTDTSNDAEMDMMIELFLTEENLKKVIDRLTKVLENERTN